MKLVVQFFILLMVCQEVYYVFDCTLSTSLFIYCNTCYRQIYGAAMGSALAVRIADNVMQFLESKINSHLEGKICFWKRYVDNMFIITSESQINDILEYTNSLCQSIQFILEIEENNRLPFLDILTEYKKS